MYEPPDALPPPLTVEVATSHRKELVVRVSGELDLLTHGTLRSALDSLQDDPATVVRVQLGQLAFCDSRGLRMLLTFVRAGRQEGRAVVIEEPSPIVRRLMTLFAPWALEPVAVSPGGLAI
jgi:anti-anti-sigma factor